MSKLVSSYENRMGIGFEDSEKKIVEIPIDKISPDAHQVRNIFDEDKLSELADSIKEQGILNPIHVYPDQEGGYIIITGERRYRASQIAGRNTVPCIVHEYVTEKDIKALQLIENLQRENLSAIETARGFKSLMETGLKQRQIAVSLGISEGTVSRFLAIVNPKKVPVEWLEEIEKHYRHVSLTDLYEIASANKKRKPQIYKKVMDKVEREVELDDIQFKEKARPEKKNAFSDQELLTAWDMLIKQKRKDVKNIALYITPKKMQTLLKMAQESESEF